MTRPSRPPHRHAASAARVATLILVGLVLILGPGWFPLPPFAVIMSEVMGGVSICALIVELIGKDRARTAVVMFRDALRAAPDRKEVA